MSKQHRRVSSSSHNFSRPVLIIFVLVIITGLLVCAMLYQQVEPGDVSAMSRFKLCLTATILLSIFTLITGSSRLKQLQTQKSRKHHHGTHHRRSRDSMPATRRKPLPR